jgi:DNA-binding winged helix-turn-helix (wHTH) protein
MVFRFGTCILDPQRHRLQRGGQPVRLRPKAFQALLYLLTHRDRTVLKQELYEQIWPQQFISEATLESTLREVRRAIGDSGRTQQLVQTVHGYGYRFVAAVEELTDVPVEIDARGMGVPRDAVAAPQQNPSMATPLPSVYGPAEEPEAHVEWDGRPQAGKPAPGGSGPSGEWKLVTVLCCAPATTAERGVSQEAEARYRRLLSLYALAQPVVRRYGGTLQPVLGDHLLIVFGVPMAQEDHAHRSVLTALELLRQARAGDMGGNPPRGDVLGLRVGLSTGQVAVGGMGDFPADSQAVVGDTVTRAIMLQARAVPGEVLCTDTTAHLVQGAVRLTAVEPVPVVGEPIPIPASRILGPYMPACLLSQWEQRLRTPFIGRRRELATLRGLMAQVQEGQGQIVGVIGEPGVGKLRLCYEFIRGSIAPPWLILEAQGTASGQATRTCRSSTC